jgi:hypothetical protein
MQRKLLTKFSIPSTIKAPGGRQWLTPVILATQEAKIRRIMV